jgi:hypothetical protein
MTPSLLTLACMRSPELGIDGGRALGHVKHRGKVIPDLPRQDGRLIRTHERNENKGEVCFSRGQLRVPRDDEDLDLGAAIGVARWW